MLREIIQRKTSRLTSLHNLKDELQSQSDTLLITKEKFYLKGFIVFVETSVFLKIKT